LLLSLVVAGLTDKKVNEQKKKVLMEERSNSDMIFTFIFHRIVTFSIEGV
jgi:hypothetical protein